MAERGRVRAPSWWRRRSLRARLTAAATLVIAIGAAVAATLLVVRIQGGLTNALDTTLRQRASDVASASRGDDIRSGIPAGRVGEIVQVVRPDGRIYAASTNITGRGRIFRFLPHASEHSTIRTVRGVRVGEEAETYRVVAERAQDKRHLIVYVGRPVDEIQDSVGDLITTLAIGVPVIVILLGIVGWLLVGRALQPVESLRRQVATMSTSDLRLRLTPSGTNDELHRLAETFNDLLRRLHSAGRRQQQFVADAAHELRSPLAAIRTQLEVAMRHPDDPEFAAAAPDLHADVLRLSRLVDDLVQLARMDADPWLRHDPVDLEEILFVEVRQARRWARVEIGEGDIAAARVVGDPDALTRVVRNLLDNAIRHAASRVDVGLAVAGPFARLTVADDGPGIAPADRRRVFERFTRLDEARSRDAGGHGLGLAIVHEIVTVHHGDVHVEDNDPGARFVVRLPLGGGTRADALEPGEDAAHPVAGG
ncbi:MAG TPA: ATP-binding protein [Streptosporangiales bacterium]